MAIAENAKTMARVMGTNIADWSMDRRETDGTLSVIAREHFERIKSNSKCTLKGNYDVDGFNYSFEVELVSAADIHTIMRLVAAPNELKVNEVDAISGYLKDSLGEVQGSYWLEASWLLAS